MPTPNASMVPVHIVAAARHPDLLRENQLEREPEIEGRTDVISRGELERLPRVRVETWWHADFVAQGVVRGSCDAHSVLPIHRANLLRSHVPEVLRLRRKNDTRSRNTDSFDPLFNVLGESAAGFIGIGHNINCP